MFIILTLIGLIVFLIKSRYFVLYALICISFEPLYITYFMELENANNYLIDILGVPFRKIIELQLLFLSLIYLTKKSKGFPNGKYLKHLLNFTYKILFALVMLTFVQMIFYGDYLNKFLKFLSNSSFFTLLINTIYFHQNSKQPNKIIDFVFYIMSILFVLFFINAAIPYFTSLNTISFTNRLEGFLYYSSNGTAYFLLLFSLILMFKKENKKFLFYEFMYNVIIFLVIICIFYTFTKTIYLTLFLLAALKYLVFSKKLSNKAFFIFAGFFIILFYFQDIIYYLSRGSDTQQLFDLNDDDDSFAFRVLLLWTPSIVEIFSKSSYLFFGSEFDSFQLFLSNLTGLQDAPHNFILNYLVNYGIFSVILVLVFWIKILKQSYKNIKHSLNTGNSMICFFIILSYFISMNLMSTNSLIFYSFITPIIVYTISLKDQIK